MISGQWCRRKRSLMNWPQNTQNYIKNLGGIPILTILVEVHPRNIQTKYDANPCRCLREVKYVI